MLLKYLIFLLGCFFYLNASATVQTQVDKHNIASDETLTLLISSHDHLSLSPDLSPLKNDFYILGTSQNTSFNIINGSTSLETQWQITLSPKHAGDLQIPELQVGKEKTQALLIHVASIKNSLLNATPNQDIFIEATVTPNESFIKEQFVYTAKVFFSRSIGNAYLMGPDLPDAKIIQNGQDIIYSVTRKGHYFRVLERSYLITPEKTGHFSIQPPVLKGYLELSNDVMDPYGLGSQSVKPIKIIGPTLNIHVKPKPANFVGHWLPAKKITLEDTFEPNPPVFRQGEPVTRIIEVTAVGATGEQIPNLVIDPTPNLNSYTQQPKRETGTSNGQQHGKLTQRVVFIPTTSGKLTLPAIKVRWWNSITQHQETTTLPAKTVQVLPAAIKAIPQSGPTHSIKTLVSSRNTVEQKDKGTTKLSQYIWPIIAILFIIIWVVTMLLWRRQIRSHDSSPKQKLKPHTLKAQIKEACIRNNAKETRILFLKWAMTHWENSSIHSLSDIVTILENEHADKFVTYIMDLEANFYADHYKKWEGLAFWEAFNDYVISHETKRHHHDDPLPPLYCTDSEP